MLLWYVASNRDEAVYDEPAAARRHPQARPPGVRRRRPALLPRRRARAARDQAAARGDAAPLPRHRARGRADPGPLAVPEPAEDAAGTVHAAGRLTEARGGEMSRRGIVASVIAVAVAVVLTAPTAAPAGAQEADTVWLCKPGQMPNPCRDSLENDGLRTRRQLAGREPAEREATEGRLLLRLPHGQRPADAQRGSHGRRTADRNRPLPGGALLTPLPSLRAGLPPAHPRRDLRRR